jgi:hypothetical protein
MILLMQETLFLDGSYWPIVFYTSTSNRDNKFSSG